MQHVGLRAEPAAHARVRGSRAWPPRSSRSGRGGDRQDLKAHFAPIPVATARRPRAAAPARSVKVGRQHYTLSWIACATGRAVAAVIGTPGGGDGRGRPRRVDWSRARGGRPLRRDGGRGASALDDAPKNIEHTNTSSRGSRRRLREGAPVVKQRINRQRLSAFPSRPARARLAGLRERRAHGRGPRIRPPTCSAAAGRWLRNASEPDRVICRRWAAASG